MPAKEHHLVLYLQHLGDTVGSKSAVGETVNTLASVYLTVGLASPITTTIVKATLEGLQRKLAKLVQKKEPVTAEMLGKMVEDAKMSGSLSDLCLTTACLLVFPGFLKFDEVIQIRPCKQAVQEDYLVLHLLSNKTDQWWKGDEVYISRTGKPTGPVAMLEAYMHRTSTSCRDERFLFVNPRMVRLCRSLVALVTTA